jgi:hypothetical protein
MNPGGAAAPHTSPGRVALRQRAAAPPHRGPRVLAFRPLSPFVQLVLMTSHRRRPHHCRSHRRRPHRGRPHHLHPRHQRRRPHSQTPGCWLIHLYLAPISWSDGSLETMDRTELCELRGCFSTGAVALCSDRANAQSLHRLECQHPLLRRPRLVPVHTSTHSRTLTHTPSYCPGGAAAPLCRRAAVPPRCLIVVPLRHQPAAPEAVPLCPCALRRRTVVALRRWRCATAPPPRPLRHRAAAPERHLRAALSIHLSRLPSSFDGFSGCFGLACVSPRPLDPPRYYRIMGRIMYYGIMALWWGLYYGIMVLWRLPHLVLRYYGMVTRFSALPVAETDQK